MSVERSLEAWEEMQRHGQDIADRLAQGFNGLLHHTHMCPPSFAWPAPPNHKLFDVEFPVVTPPSVDPAAIHDGVSAIFDIGNKLGQAGVQFGACLNGVVQQFFRRLLPQMPLPPTKYGRNEAFIRTEFAGRRLDDVGFEHGKDSFGSETEGFSDYGYLEAGVDEDDCIDEDTLGLNLRSLAHLGRSQGSINITSIYDSRTNDIESSLVARGDLWRAEASHGGISTRNESSPHFLIQLGPVLFVRDTTLLFPVHLSSQHLLWYGFDRKNGMHSLCPAVWSKHRRWLLMSMICLNPLTCSFMDLQFPNGQFTYLAGEGLTCSAFLPIFGGLLQAQGQYPGETKFSFSYKNKWGMCIKPAVQWPDKSFSLGFVQDMVWQKSGLLVRPTIQISLCPTVGGSNPGVRAEVIHYVREKLSVACGCLCTAYPTAFGSVSIGRSKFNGNVGNTGVVIKVEAPLSSVCRPFFSIQLNSGVEF